MQGRNFPRMGRLNVAPRLPFARATVTNNQRGTTLTFTVSGNWVVPAGVSTLNSVRGKGSDGKPASGAHDYVAGYNIYKQVITYAEYTDGGSPNSGPQTFAGQGVGTPPAPYCGERTYWPSSGYIQSITCYSFENATVDQGDYVDATAGFSSVAFTKTFPAGDVGLPAIPVTFYNVKVIPKSTYSLIVPVGGFVTITY